jgi:protein SCO1
MTPTRPRRLRRLASVAMATVVVSLLGAACGGGTTGSNATVQQVGGPPETTADYPGALLFARAYPKPDVTLTDTSDQPYDIATATKGQVTLLYFGYTHCPDLCPLNMFTAANAIGRLPAEDRQRVHVVFVSTDPDRDTPPVIRTWLDHFDDSFIGLTGTIDQIRQAEEATGIPLSFAEHVSGPGGSYAVVHAGYILVYTRDNRAHLEFPAEISVTQESRDLESLLNHGFQA